jgi:predicted NBD/HSP70 family sugar kinase
MSREPIAMKGPYRIGVDIGGTFTDLVMIDSQGHLVNEKVLTTPHDPSQGVLTGVSLITKNNGVLPEQVDKFRHAVISYHGIRRHFPRRIIVSETSLRWGAFVGGCPC